MITPRELEWAAGFLEGEGTFRTDGHGVCLSVEASQVQKQPVERLLALFGGSLCVCEPTAPRQDIWKWNVTGVAAAGLHMTMYGLMSPARRDQIRRAMTLWKARPAGMRYRTTCKHGHPLSGTNLRRWGKHKTRHCYACFCRRQLASRANAKLAAGVL